MAWPMGRPFHTVRGTTGSTGTSRKRTRRDLGLARRAADARLPGDPGAGEPDRWRLARQPRLRLSDSADARGRGFDLEQGDRGQARVLINRRRAKPGREPEGKGPCTMGRGPRRW